MNMRERNRQRESEKVWESKREIALTPALAAWTLKLDIGHGADMDVIMWCKYAK